VTRIRMLISPKIAGRLEGKRKKERSWRSELGSRRSPVKFTVLLFFEKFNGPRKIGISTTLRQADVGNQNMGKRN